MAASRDFERLVDREPIFLLGGVPDAEMRESAERDVFRDDERKRKIFALRDHGDSTRQLAREKNVRELGLSVRPLAAVLAQPLQVIKVDRSGSFDLRRYRYDARRCALGPS